MAVKVFISSTIADLHYEREVVEEECRALGMEVLAFPEYSTAGTGSRDYLRELESAQVLIHLQGIESMAVREEIERAQEIGIQIIRLVPSEISFSRGIAGPTTATASARSSGTFAPNFTSLAELRKQVRGALGEAVARRFDNRHTLTIWNGDSYRDAARSVKLVNRRLSLVQSTSSLILGPRAGRVGQERAFVRAVDALVTRIRDAGTDGEAPAFTHVFHVTRTHEAIAEGSKVFGQLHERREVLRDLYLPLIDSGRITFCAVGVPLTPALLWDNSMEAGFTIGNHILYGRYPEYGAATQTLWDVIEEIRCRRRSSHKPPSRCPWAPRASELRSSSLARCIGRSRGTSDGSRLRLKCPLRLVPAASQSALDQARATVNTPSLQRARTSSCDACVTCGVRTRRPPA